MQRGTSHLARVGNFESTVAPNSGLRVLIDATSVEGARVERTLLIVSTKNTKQQADGGSSVPCCRACPCSKKLSVIIALDVSCL